MQINIMYQDYIISLLSYCAQSQSYRYSIVNIVFKYCKFIIQK